MDNPFDNGLNFWACQYIARNDEYLAESESLEREQEALIEAARNSSAAASLAREVEDEEDHLSNVEYFARKCPKDTEIHKLAGEISAYRAAWSAFLDRYNIACRVDAYRVDAETIITSLLDDRGFPVPDDFPYPVDLKSPVILMNWNLYLYDKEMKPAACPRLTIEVDITAPGAAIRDALHLRIQEAREQARTLGYTVQEKAGHSDDPFQKDIKTNLEPKVAALIHRYDPRSDASRALGLWLRDRRQLTKESTQECIEALELTGWPSDLRGDEETSVDLRFCLKKTDECIRAGKVLAFTKKN